MISNGITNQYAHLPGQKVRRRLRNIKRQQMVQVDPLRNVCSRPILPHRSRPTSKDSAVLAEAAAYAAG